MAPLVSKQTLDRLKNILSLGGSTVITGSKGDTRHLMPVYQRSDGVTLKLGNMVVREEEGVVFTIRNIMVRADLSEVTITISPVDEKENVEVKNEEMVCGVEEVQAMKGKSVALQVARDGMESVARSIASSPEHVQKHIRKHQLAVAMRKEVQKFLGGFSMSGSSSLGCVDWRLDPAILGLERDTDFCVEYRVERFVEQVSHMDQLMGKEWDVRPLSGTDGYRIILTLEMMVDSSQELVMKMHATLVSGKLDPSCYRTVCLRDTTNPHTACNRRLSDITQDGTSRANTHGLTLAWDEFQTQSAENSPSRAPDVPTVTVSMDDMFTGSGSLQGFPTTSTAFHSLERLLSSIPQSQLVFNSPIKEVSGEYTHLSTTAGTGPNTSTPADLLDQTGDHSSHTHSRADAPEITPHSSPSLQGHRTVEENITKQGVEINEEVPGSPNLNDLTENMVTIEDSSTTPVPIEQMQTTPDNKSKDESSPINHVNCNEQTSSENVAAVPNEDFEDSDDSIGASDAVKPSPNISMDEISNPGKAQFSLISESLPTDFSLSKLDKLDNSKLDQISSSNPLLSSPPKKTNLARVQEYLQSLPSPARRDNIPETPNSKYSTLDNGSTPGIDEDCNASICSGSQSIASRQSDLSSLTGARLGRGLFYGLASAAESTAPVCPFPEDWQFNTIPESIENDEDID